MKKCCRYIKPRRPRTPRTKYAYNTLSERNTSLQTSGTVTLRASATATRASCTRTPVLWTPRARRNRAKEVLACLLACGTLEFVWLSSRQRNRPVCKRVRTTGARRWRLRPPVASLSSFAPNPPSLLLLLHQRRPPPLMTLAIHLPSRLRQSAPTKWGKGKVARIPLIVDTREYGRRLLDGGCPVVSPGPFCRIRRPCGHGMSTLAGFCRRADTEVGNHTRRAWIVCYVLMTPR